jgi:hypothetical protein
VSIILTEWLVEKGGYFYNQSTEIETFEKSIPGNIQDGAGDHLSGFCFTASLYWIRCLKKRPNLGFEAEDRALLWKKREKMYHTHKAATREVNSLGAELSALKLAIEDFQRRSEALRELGDRIDAANREKKLEKLDKRRLAVLAQKADYKRHVEAAAVRIGDASLNIAYVNVATKYKLTLADGKAGRFDPDGDVGADIAKHLVVGSYYLLVLSDSNNKADMHSLGICVSHGGWMDRAGIRDAAVAIPSRMYLFDPNLGNFSCGFQKSGARLLRELFLSYRDDTEIEIEYDRWSLFTVR